MPSTEISPEHWRFIEEVFHEALAIPADQRDEFLQQRCKGNARLLAEVVLLLSACEAQEKATKSWHRENQTGNKNASNRRIGPYELDRLLGRGGAGAVYLAHRVDGQFEQCVAIKLIDLPLVTELFQQRFRRERQILATLNHPHIARLLDGGATEDGELYVVMEYVEGIAVDRYCNQQRLSVRQRLFLFQSICAAVQYAHQNLVVHRDLKPDNILVLADGKPKLLDFGTAKLLAPVAADADSESTRQGFYSFTPQYASPEQVLGTPVTTASDIYSLGVLLYLLLSGSLPYELKEFTTAEMVRVICEERPERLSAHASHRIGAIHGDLDAIVAKALRKEPRERYPTVDQFSADIQSYLDSRPVVAREGNVRYQIGKFVRRNKVALGVAALLGVSVLAGIVGILWQARIAGLQQREAEARSEDLRQLSNSLLSELDDAIKQLPGSTPAQRLLVTRVLEHLDRMSRDSTDRASQLDLVDAYTRLGNLQGNPYDQNISDTAGALASFGKALAIAEPLVRSQPNDPQGLHELGFLQQSQSEVLFGIGKTQEAVATMQSAAKTLGRIASRPDATPAVICEAAAAYGSLGDELGQSGMASMGDRDGALASYQKVLALDHRALELDPKFVRALRGIGIMHMKIGDAESDTDDSAALSEYRQALDALDALPDTEKEGVLVQRVQATILWKLALVQRGSGDYTESLSNLEKSRVILEKLADVDPEDSRARNNLASVFENEALDYEDRVPTASSAQPGNSYRTSAISLLQASKTMYEDLLKKDPKTTSGERCWEMFWSA